MRLDELTPEFPALHPSVKVSQANQRELSLDSFQVLVVVEPNPESWMISDAVYGWAEEINENLSEEIMHMAESKGGLPLFVWIRTYDNEPLFAACTEDARLVLLPGPEIGDDVEALLADLSRGLHNRIPSSEVAVIGAALEDEVVWAANICANSGLSTTILKRYCLSYENFIDLDAVQQEEHTERAAHRILTGEDTGSWLDQLAVERAQRIADQFDIDLSAAGFDEKLAQILKELGLDITARVEVIFTDPDDPEETAGPAIHFWRTLEPGALSVYRTSDLGGDYWRIVRWQAWGPGEREDDAKAKFGGNFSPVPALKAERIINGPGFDTLRDALGIALQLMCALHAEQHLNNQFEVGEDEESLWGRLLHFRQ